MTSAGNRPEAITGLFNPNASRTTPLHSVALRVTNPSTKILLLEPTNPIDNPHRGSGDWLGRVISILPRNISNVRIAVHIMSE